MKWPAFFSRKYGRAAVVTIIVQKRFVSICARNSDRDVSSTDDRLPYPGSDHGADVGSGDGRRITLPHHQAGDQLLRSVRRRTEFGRQGDADAPVEVAEQAHPARAGGGCETGTATEPGTGHGPRKGEAKRQQQQSHSGGGPEDGGVSAGRGPATMRVYSCRTAQ